MNNGMVPSTEIVFTLNIPLKLEPKVSAILEKKIKILTSKIWSTVF